MVMAWRMWPSIEGMATGTWTSSGSGTAAASGLVPRIAHGLPTPGNSAFRISIDRAPPFAPLVLAASRARVSPIPASQIVVDLAPGLLLWPPGA